MHVRQLALGPERSVQDVHQFLWRPEVRDAEWLQRPRNIEPGQAPVRVLVRLRPGDRRRRVQQQAEQSRAILQWPRDVPYSYARKQERMHLHASFVARAEVQ